MASEASAPVPSPGRPLSDTSVFKCSVCQRTFARREHLIRHTRKHTKETPYTCPTCEKKFSRADILLRHQNSHLASETGKSLGATTNFRACILCASTRIRCSGENPCERCLKKGTECTYPVHRKRKGTSTEREKNYDSQHVSNSVVQTTDAFEMSSGEDPVGIRSTDHGEVCVPTASVPANHPGTESTIHDLQFHPRWTDQTSDVQQIQSRIADQRGLMDYLCYDHNLEQGFYGQSLPSMNWLSPSNEIYENWNSQFTSFIEPIESEASALSSTTDNLVFSGESLNAWNSETAMQTTGVSSDMSVDNPLHTGPVNSIAPDTADSRITTGLTATSRYYVDNKGARASAQQLRRKRGLIYSRPRSVTNPLQGILRSNIPVTSPLEQACQEEQMTMPICWVSADLYSELLQNIQLSNGKDRGTTDMATFPSFEHFNIFCQLYFDHFHPGFPLIRKQVFRMEKDASLLALAVATVGVYYTHTDAPEISAWRQILSDSLRAMLEFVINDATKDGEQFHTTTLHNLPSMGDRIVVVQSRILRIILMIHSGDAALMSTAYSEFSALVAACNRMKLLSAVDDKDLIWSQTSDHSWENKWVRTQLRIRAGFMIWLLDYMFMYEFNKRPQMDLSDAQAPLPCSQELLENSAWSSTTAQLETTTLFKAMDTLYTEKRLIPNISEFGRILLVHAICRQTTEVYNYSRNRMATWLPSASIQPEEEFVPPEIWPPSSPMISKWRNSACDSLDILHWSANSKAAQLAGFEHPTILHLHLARLIILTPMFYIQDLAELDQWKFETQASAAIFTFPPDKVKSTRQVLQWAIRDQYKARLSIIHAAAIFWYIRRYSCDSFVEPFAVYISTLVIWAYSVSRQLARRQENFRSINLTSQKHGTDTSMHGTSASTAIPGNSAAPSDEDSDPDPSFIHIDRPCDDESVQMFMRRGHKVTANMSRIGDICADGAPKKILLEGIRILTDGAGLSRSGIGGSDQDADSDDSMCTWGLTKSYAHSLQRLVRSISLSEQRTE